MIDEEIKIALNEKHGDLNFKGLLEHMEASGIDFKANPLRGPLGIATYYCVYLDMAKIDYYHDKMLFFIILHEMGHYKRIANVGKDHIIKMLSLEDFEEFCQHVITEEIVADRYSAYCYYLLNKEVFPKGATQQLENKDRQRQYKSTAKHLFGQIQK